MMSKIFFLIGFTFSSLAIAQVAIGKNTITNNSVSLEFGSDITEKRGIVLPWVVSSSSVTGAVDGTIIYDTSDKKIKYKKSGNWFDLTVETSGAVNTSLQDSKTELESAKVAIGKNAETDTTPGILVLTDTDKAMILPKVAMPHLNIKNPAPGMMVYDTVNRQLAVFNGTNWSFWKP